MTKQMKITLQLTNDQLTEFLEQFVCANTHKQAKNEILSFKTHTMRRENSYGAPDRALCDDKKCRRNTGVAASRRHLGCLKYAHEHGYEWRWEVTYYAAWNGDLKCLKYACENGCPLHFGTAYIAAYTGQIECLKYTTCSTKIAE